MDDAVRTQDPDSILHTLQESMRNAASDQEAREVIRRLTAETRRLRSIQMHGGELPPSPAAQALELDGGYRLRPHITYLSDRIAKAVHDVENGTSRHLRVSLPPRYGKTSVIGWALPTWLLRLHPDWPIVIASHESTLATKSGRAVRRTIEQDPGLGITLAADAGAASEWETTAGGGVIARGIHGSLTGRGARLMILDDLVKDFVAAHSQDARQALWDWWLTVAQTRLERPYLAIAVGTRWHEDDFLGRLASSEYEGDPADWENITIPAFAEEGDLLGRAPGDPLMSPLVDETPEEATKQLEQTRINVGSYAFDAMYQQRPSPAQGAIFNAEWWRYWTTDPGKATDDGRVVYVPDVHELVKARTSRVLESWDCAFKGTDGSDYVVGQRWCRQGVRRYLLAQQRGRWTFTETLTRMRAWADRDHEPAAWYVHERLVEDKANGTAVIDVLTDEIDGMLAVNPTQSKEARARAVTPECEAGNVYLPHPADPGNEWVRDLLSEFRDFPRAIHDDQVDAATQALMKMRDPREGSITNPGSRPTPTGSPLVRSMTRRQVGPRATPK